MQDIKIYCVRRLTFCSGHRVYQHEGKCAHPHGHNYVVHLTCMARTLDSIGRVIDFSIIKKIMGDWIDDNWDHGFILYAQDTELIGALGDKGFKLYMMPTNPTAENMGAYLLHTICPRLFKEHGVEVIKVEIEETENCKAIVRK